MIHQTLHMKLGRPTLTVSTPNRTANFPANRKHVFHIACSIASFARGFSSDPDIRRRERATQAAFAVGEKFVVQP